MVLGEDDFNIRPELSLGRRHLPWALARVRGNPGVRPEGAGHARGSASAKDAAASISHAVGTSAIVRSQNACASFAAGRRLDGKPDVARIQPSRPDTPRRRKRAARKRSPRLRLLRTRMLRPRVVTQQKLFFLAGMRSARMPRTPREFSPQPRALLLPCLPSGRSQCPRSRTQVALSRHLGWAEEASHRVSSRTAAPRPAARFHH